MSIGHMYQQVLENHGWFARGLAAPWERSGDLLARWDHVSIAKFAAITLQLTLLVALARLFQINNPAFYNTILPLVLVGFILHQLLARPYRLPFFLFLSVVGILGVLGVASGLWLVGIGLALVGICHIPASLPIRVCLLLSAGAVLALLRAGWAEVPWSQAIWPILGSMFMFRLIIYLYDIQHEKVPAGIWHRLSYFFLLPNVVFPFFPIVDYGTFRRTYYHDDEYRIYQRGLQLMFIGLTHLILYRLIYHYVAVSPEDVVNGGTLLRFAVSNYLLYLQVSGAFHLIIGMLHLFGFDLPPTHYLYFLATGFNDMWRRANVYWKDFMMKVFYYPSYMRFRKLGPTVALVLSTGIVCVVTWFLHSYQWFWLVGAPLLSWTDVAFWTALGLLLLANTLYEAKRGRQRTVAGHARSSMAANVSTLLHAAGMFAFMCVLWSFWVSPTIADGLALWSIALGPRALEGLRTSLVPDPSGWSAVAIGALALAVAAGFWGTSRIKVAELPTGSTGSQAPFFKAAALMAISISVVYVVATPRVSAALGATPAQALRTLRSNELNAADADLQVRGYYENLVGASRFNGQLWEVYSQQPVAHRRTLTEIGAKRPTGDFIDGELVPSGSFVFQGEPFHTNQWGMRDREYTKDKPPGTYRAVLLGPSYAMGFGVADNETFEWLIEDRLNGENQGERYARYELLNFSLAGRVALHQLAVFENKAMAFEPDAVYLFGNASDAEKSLRHLAEMNRAKREIPYEYLRDVLRRAEVDETTTAVLADSRLKPFGLEVLEWTYRRIAEDCARRGIRPVWIHLPVPGHKEPTEEIKAMARLAEETGFTTLILSDVYKGHDTMSLQVMTNVDTHPNAEGHQIIAERLYRELREKVL